MNTKQSIVVTAILAGLFAMSGCDPVYGVILSNEKSDTVVVIARTTANFHTDDTLNSYEAIDSLHTIKFKMPPGSRIVCGETVAMGLESQLPFSSFKWYSKGDTIVAANEEQVLRLFDHHFWGSLEKPYQLTIR